MASLTVVLIAAAFLLLFSRAVWNERVRLRRYAHLPRVGLEQETWFGLMKARIKNIINYRARITDLFQRYSQHGKACALHLLTDDFVVLPPAELDWIINQQDDVLNSRSVAEDTLQLDYTVADQYIRQHLLHHEVIKRDLTRRLGELTSDIIEELAAAIDDEWGTDVDSWKEIVMFPSLMSIIARTSNRVFVGLPLCRDKILLENGAGFAQTIMPTALILRQVPPIFRSLASLLLTYKTKSYARKFIEHLRPTIKARQTSLIASTTNDAVPKERNENQIGNDAPQNDFLQWLIVAASKTQSARENDPATIAARILNLNFAAIHTSTFSITNAVFDITSPPSSQTILTALRNEVSTTLAENKGVWSKKSLSQMHLLDSTLRESSRLRSFVTLGLPRKVVAKSGVTTPISNTFLPYGTTVCVPTNAIHHDESNYKDAQVFKPFRFAELRNTTAGSHDHVAAPSGALAFTTTSPTYHPFGHGRHACPGRFFASHELKLLLAYIVQNYEFEMLPERPENVWMGTTVLPPMKHKIKVRRRREV